MASNKIFQKAEDWLDDLETVGTYAAEKIGSVTKDMPIVKSLGAIAANPTRQEIGAQVINLASATNKGLQESFGGDPVDMALNYGPGAIGAMTAFHGGEAIKKINLNKSRYDKTFYVSDNPIYAKSYGGDKSVLNKVEISDNANLADMTKPSNDLIQKISEATGEDFYPYTKKTVIEGIAAGKAHFAEMPVIKKVLKKLGYDGQITSEVPFAKNIGIWNKEVIGEINALDFLDN